MDEPGWCVVVVRAWCDSGALRARLLRTGSGESEYAVEHSARAAALRLESWLAAVAAGADEADVDRDGADDPRTQP